MLSHLLGAIVSMRSSA